ncbi:DUF599 domain-containing protein [Defluviimonas sp. SAOS-178_SWC]|uniref:DUF599 domain-containing protein n=1 Tax=Defluviimonas sp. SAOS-178_SWC TaxID=3121287 RepID=UPI003221B2CB
MTDLIATGHLTTADLAALAFLLLAWLGFGLLVEHAPARRPSVSGLMVGYRREWMRQFVTRDPRIFDAAIMDNLRQGTSFFASATMIAIGGGVALIGDTERLLGLAEDLTLASAPAAVWEAKIIVVILFLTNAFLKFVWSHRLFGYCAILMAAVPNDPADPLAYPRAEQAADVNIFAARSFNRGLRAIYFALGSLAWILGPIALALATLATLTVLWRREFASLSRKVLMKSTPK